MVTEERTHLEPVARGRLSAGCPDVPARVLSEVASGVDALYLSGHGELPSGLLEELETLRAAATSSKSGSSTSSQGDLSVSCPTAGGATASCSSTRLGESASRRVATFPLSVQPGILVSCTPSGQRPRSQSWRRYFVKPSEP